MDLRAEGRRADPARHARRARRCRSSSASGSTAAKGVKLDGKRIVVDHHGVGQDVRGQDVHRRDLRGRPDGRRGVSYTVGREPNTQYGETLNGVARKWNTHNCTASSVKVDPYVKPGDPKSGLLFGIDPDPLPADGEGDQRLQAYCFRMCMSERAGEPRPVPEAGRLRRGEVRAAVPQLRGRRPALPDEARHDAQRQDRHEQQLRRQHRLHRPELQVPRGELRRAREDHRGPRVVPEGADVDARRTTRACRRRSATRWRSGAWRRTSSPTTATGRTRSTSARPGGWWATTS